MKASQTFLLGRLLLNERQVYGDHIHHSSVGTMPTTIHSNTDHFLT